MSPLGQKQTFVLQDVMSASRPKATSVAFLMSALMEKQRKRMRREEANTLLDKISCIVLTHISGMAMVAVAT
jgi:hypothetical protein